MCLSGELLLVAKVAKHRRTAGKAALRGIYEINSGGKAQGTKIFLIGIMF